MSEFSSRTRIPERLEATEPAPDLEFGSEPPAPASSTPELLEVLEAEAISSGRNEPEMLEILEIPSIPSADLAAAATPRQVYLPFEYLEGERYKLLRPLGAGGMGAVYAAYDRNLDMEVAIKLVPNYMSDRHSQTLLLRELQSAATLEHPNTLRVLNAGICPYPSDDIFVVMPLISGSSLYQKARAYHSTPPAQRDPAEGRKLVDAVVQMLDGVEHGHSRDVYHRDLKPSNVMVGNNGVVKVIDFGLALVKGERREQLETLPPYLVADEDLSREEKVLLNLHGDAYTPEAPGLIIGTPGYISPELETGQGRAADRRSDIYSAGIILYQMLAGFPDPLSQSQLKVSPKALLRQIPRVDPELVRIAVKAMHPDPEKRYETAAEMKADMVRALETQEERMKALEKPGGITAFIGRQFSNAWNFLKGLATREADSQ